MQAFSDLDYGVGHQTFAIAMKFRLDGATEGSCP